MTFLFFWLGFCAAVVIIAIGGLVYTLNERGKKGFPRTRR